MDLIGTTERSALMARIKQAGTRPELLVRKGLHARGLRYRLNVKALSGRPDIVLPRWRAVVFVHGCFWHGHDCPLFKWPSTRPIFWRNKIEGNRRRDMAVVEALQTSGWRVLVIWECALKGAQRKHFSAVIDECENFIKRDRTNFKQISLLY